MPSARIVLCRGAGDVLLRRISHRLNQDRLRSLPARHGCRPGASRAAAPGARPRSGADRRELSLAQAQIRGAEPSASPSAGPPGQHDSATRSPRAQHPRRRRGMLPRRASAASPRRAAAKPHRQAPQHMAARLAHQSRGAARARWPANQARNNSGQYPLRPAAQSRCSAQLTCCQIATRKRYPAPENNRVYIRIISVTWVSYGDSNPRPLACHAEPVSRSQSGPVERGAAHPHQ